MKQKKVIKKVIKNVTQKKEIIKKDNSRYLCSLVENAETQLIQDEIQGKIIEKLAYHFVDKHGKHIDGLTFWGLLACAKEHKKNKWIPVFSKPDYQNLTDGFMLLTVCCKNPKTKQEEFGNCTFNPKIRFDERTALTNAKRYALDKHIDVQQKVLFIQYLKEHKPKSIMQIESGENFEAKPTKFTISDSGKIKTKTIENKKDKQVEQIGNEIFEEVI